MNLTNQEVDQNARRAAHWLMYEAPLLSSASDKLMYPVPRGGIPAAYAIKAYLPAHRWKLADSAHEASVIVDDIIDTGKTRDRFPDKTFVALVGKLRDRVSDPSKTFASNWINRDTWVTFPWEKDKGEQDGSADDIPTRLIQYIGDDPTREGLLDTPQRFLRAWKEWGAGYTATPINELLRTFDDGAEGCGDEIVLVSNIPVYSYCEHHLAMFWGLAHVGYLPNQRIVGLSKLARVVNVFARRLQVQERLTNQIADALTEHLNPHAVGVIVECRHSCMESRGVHARGTVTTTSALRGHMKNHSDLRSEFLQLVLNASATRKGL